MADEPTVSGPVVHEGMSRAEVNQALATHKEEVKNMYEAHRTKLLEDINQLGAGDKQERDELKQQLKDLKDWKDQEDKKREDSDKVKNDSHTIVTPPANIPPPTAPTDGQPTGDTNSGEKVKRSWKDWI